MIIFVTDLPVRVIESCSGDRTVVDANMVALMTYMGHSQIDSTYWYLHATPYRCWPRSQIYGGKLSGNGRPLMTPLAPHITVFLLRAPPR
jgi:hypothetical protein